VIEWWAVTRPENVEGARIAGMESGVDLRAPRRALALRATYTMLDTLNLDGSDAPLPGRPRHDLFARLSTGYEWVVRQVEIEPRIFYTFELVASTFLDPSARLELPTRDFHGLGAELHLARRVHAAVEVRNLTDRRTATVTLPVANASPQTMPLSDFIGYPLPGRTVWVTLRVDMELPRQARKGDTA
jgi:iron complex outermembrane receptor protein